MTLNLRRGLVGKVQPLGPCVWDHWRLANCRPTWWPTACIAFTQAAHPATGVGILMCWHPKFMELGEISL